MMSNSPSPAPTDCCTTVVGGAAVALTVEVAAAGALVATTGTGVAAAPTVAVAAAPGPLQAASNQLAVTKMTPMRWKSLGFTFSSLLMETETGQPWGQAGRCMGGDDLLLFRLTKGEMGR